MEKLSLEQGQKLVKLARKSISYYSATGALLGEQCSEKELLEKRGVFVTINSFPEKELRGCIGFPSPIKPLWNAVIEAGVEASFNDPRFSGLKGEELEKIVIELSVLTKPEEIKGEKSELPNKIVIGEDGLIIQREGRSGLLLPIVAVEYNWESEEFLENACRKAFLPENSWHSERTHVFKFQSQVFAEEKPNGSINEIDLKKEMEKK
jgi:uncharacterized protein (TIGR00296 family)